MGLDQKQETYTHNEFVTLPLVDLKYGHMSNSSQDEKKEENARNWDIQFHSWFTSQSSCGWSIGW